MLSAVHLQLAWTSSSQKDGMIGSMKLHQHIERSREMLPGRGRSGLTSGPLPTNRLSPRIGNVQ